MPVAAAILLALPTGAQAAPARPPSTVPAGLNETIETPHFVVHYTTAASDPNASTAEHAQALADSGEKAYAIEVGQWGFAPPVDDGDGKTDIYVFAGTQGLARADRRANSTSGYITYTPAGNAIHIPHEFFHLIQFGIYAFEGGWLAESTADWAAVGVAGHVTTKPFAFSRPFVSLDCLGEMPTDCGGDRYGYRGDIFFEFLSERYGPGTIREIFERAGVLGADNHERHSLQALGDVLQAHGSSVEQAWNDYAVAGAAGHYSLPGLSALRPTLDRAIAAGDSDSASVDHLAVRYLGIEASSFTCGKATLRLTVTVPAGVPAVPALVDGKGNVTPAGSPVDVPWDACNGSATLVLPNASTIVDGARFGIETHVTRVPTAPPSLKLTAPGSVTLGASKPKLRFKLTSSGQGVAKVVLHSKRAVTTRRNLRKGANRITLTLPKGFKAGRHTLTVTPVSTSGAKGKPVKATIRFKRRG